MSFHKTLTPERWGRFAFADQIIMIANEMHRASSALDHGDREQARGCYWRALDLVDLTVEILAMEARGRRKELLRFRELLAELYCEEEPALAYNQALLRALLLFTPRSAEQIAEVCPEA